ncbi:hypothetical protein H6P81_005738 [Aristolochia fimbriata]|uniref:Uncharacterized protein n=1 Tax=Aristolochia fimbriata TaxID=158543 RepID=A0AAV7EW14_ARIFI|nr:hypothetical protein H6P81_005738 [Aristolochia fimbriata]
MAGVFGKGKVLLILLLFVSAPQFPLRFLFGFCSSVEHAQDSRYDVELEGGEDTDLLGVDDRQELQLRKLEELVKNLTDAVAKLESSLSELDKSRSANKGSHHLAERVVNVKSDDDFGGRLNLAREEGVERKGEGNDAVRTRGVTVTKYKPSWSERFQFLSAVKLESEPTCINILPYEDYEGFSKYVAVGDERGMIYIFMSNGDVLVEFDTLSDSPVTSMLSYMSIWKNESVLVTGHKDGAILVHRVWEASNGDDWSSLSMRNLRALTVPEKSEEDSSIMILELHLVGRIRYIMSSDTNGKIRIFLENGTLYGGATSLSRPLAFVKQRLMFLTENGAGSLDLRTMTVRESECEGLNGSFVKSYAFDSSERSKAYGFTSEKELIHVVLLGDIMNFKCLVRSKRKTDVDGPLVVNSIKGYLLVVNQETVFMYNVSSPHYMRMGGPRPLFFATIDEIRSAFVSSDSLADDTETRKPLISSDREKLVVLGLGSGYVGLYRSTLPVFKAEFNSVLWSSPVVLCILFLIGVWQFVGKKKESLTAWGPDDPFSATSMATGVSLGSGSGDRTYADSSRGADLMDLRGGALRGPSRRYGSPSRYTGAAATSFRPNPADPNYRAAAELKYRGQNLEMAGFPKRREPLFSNNQVADDAD